jgi:hypothetical protein
MVKVDEPNGTLSNHKLPNQSISDRLISCDPDFRKVADVKVLTETQVHHKLKE